MTTNWIGIATLYKRETWRFLKVWNQTLVAPVITTLIFLAVLTLAMGGSSSRMIHEMPFITFITPGLIMMAMVQNAFANTSSSFMIAKLQGVIIDWLVPPLSAAELLAGFTAGGITRGLMVGITVSAAMAVFTPISVASWTMVIVFAVLSTTMLSLLGIVTGIFGNTPDQVSAITNFVVTPLSFLSGTFYSIHDLPEFFRDISHANPFFYMIDGFRHALTGRSDADPLTGALVLLGTNLALLALAHTMFARGWRLKS